ncbi:PREDICTED: vinorine synthase-like [Camelina sativa]|uniref:Vinorine synthase-like n=1 Tax=Camelina sativa TaxID=90675 RepID=A0ABM1QWD5_CAMSA|nr:PREDICTED: vinorine synthase-like [Camelina sativa]
MKIFDVSFTGEFIVKASGDQPEKVNSLTLSNLDLLSGRFPVTYFYFYPKQPNVSFETIFKSLQASLSETLNYFHPFAGQIVTNEASQEEPIIICNNNGALLVEARASVDLKSLDFYNLDALLQSKLVRVNPDFSLQIQATEFECGGLAITFTFDHALGDASSFGKFLTLWSEISRNQPVSCVPDHRRNLLRARSPPCYDPHLDKTFIKCSEEDIKNIAMPKTLIKRLNHIDASSIDKLQVLATVNGESRTKIEAFSAYVWKKMVDSIESGHKTCKMGWLVDGRGRRPALVLSSGRRFPVAELDFGFGAPFLGTVCSTVEKIGVGYLNQRPSACNDGSWSVSAIVWPELAEAFESDSVFQPMSAKHLQLQT